MAQMLTERGTSTAPTGVITVADLLSRYAPDPVVDPEPGTAPVSVGSLLQREGRAAAGGPVAAQPADGYDDEPEPAAPARRGPALRRSAIAAGILLAAGSMFGATSIISNSAAPTGDVPQPTGGYPGQGLLDPQQQLPAGAVPTVVDNTAQTDPLDPGAGAPTSWMSTAFPDGPGNNGGSGTGPAGSATPAPAGTGTPPAAVTPLVADPENDGSGGGVQNDGSGQGGGGDDQGGDSDQGGDDQGGGGQGGGGQGGDSGAQPEQGGGGVVGGAVERIGGALPNPLDEPVQALGRTVSSLL